MNHLVSPPPKENAEALVVCCCSIMFLDRELKADRCMQEFCKRFLPMDKYEIIIAGD